MSKIKVKCVWCEKDFEKLKKEFNRCEKEGMKHCCNRSCSMSYRNSLMTKGYWKIQYEKQKDKFDIKSLAGNMRDEYTPFRQFIKKCKGRNFKFDLTLEYLKNLWIKQNGICPYTKLSMLLFSKDRNCLKSASLDRINSKEGYVMGNVEFVCLAINYAKNDFTKEDMTSFITDLISHQNTLSVTQVQPT